MKLRFSINRRDACAAGLLCVLGLGVVVHGSSYPVGNLSNMGPGFFPVMLGALLVFLGVLCLLANGFSPAEDEEEAPEAPAQWRGWCGIIGGLIAFIIIGRYGGLAPATFALVFISAMGDRSHTLRSALLLALFVTVLGLVIFSWGLELSFPVFNWG